MFDTSRTFETPEGVALQLRVAGVVVRALAWTIDAAIRLMIYIGMAIITSPLGAAGGGIMLISVFLIEWFYPVFFEVLNQGQTPGKKAMKIAVVNDNGTPVGWTPSIIRNLLRVADFFPALYGTGVVTMLLNADFKRLGDFAAGTLVIYKASTVKKVKLPETETATPLTPAQPLSLVEQRAILDFAERSHLLSKQRQAELAQLLEGITGEKEGEKSVKILFQYANWLHGNHKSK